MLIKQFYLGCLAHASYLIADEAAGVAAVVDPQRDVDLYLEEAGARGLRITHVFLTHFHADFLAGHLELRERTGAVIGLGSRAQAEYPFTAFDDGAELELGRVRLRVLHTPGHTPESVTLLVWEAEAPPPAAPAAALTGDTLFVGDVGRPDLRAAQGWPAEKLGAMLHDSLGKLLALPDAVRIYPAHGAGSLCGRQLGSETFSTLGEQRRSNYALQPMTRAAFLELVLADQPEAPAYFSYDAVLNTRWHAALETTLENNLRPLSAAEWLEARAAGAQMLDTRQAAAYCGGHAAGAIQIGLEGQFATWCGSLLDRERPIVLLADPGREREAALRLGRIGFDHVQGYLAGGSATLAAWPEGLEAHERIEPAELARRLDAAEPPLLVDVRSPGEHAAGAIAGSQTAPLAQWRTGMELPRTRPLVLYCQGGYRSLIASSLLRAHGYTQIADLQGGYAAWQTLAPQLR